MKPRIKNILDQSSRQVVGSGDVGIFVFVPLMAVSAVIVVWIFLSRHAQ